MVATTKEPDHLPAYLVPAHEICLFHYRVLVELIRSAEKHGSFKHGLDFRDEADLLEWLARRSQDDERATFLRRTIFPALLTDFLQFLYGALGNSRAGSLNVTYALLRKPLQENLFLLETIAADIDEFVRYFTENPLRLDSQKAGGTEAHAKRIDKVIVTLREEDRFDAAYMAQLRYDKKADDGFDGTCNLAMHLFTGHHAISTPPLNINFIFSGLGEKLTQWHYLYSRLPYLLFYVRRLVEHIYASLKIQPILFT